MKLSTNFTLEEFEKTSTGITNRVPDSFILKNLQYGVENILQPLRDALGVPVVVTSGYRCAAVNAAVGGVGNSQHVYGEAADIVVPLSKFAATADFLRASPFVDQVLSGSTFFHVSWVRPRTPRHYINLTHYR